MFQGFWFEKALNQTLFPAPTATYNRMCFPGQMLSIPQVRGCGELFHEYDPEAEDVPCVLISYPSARNLIMFLHGNAEDMGTCYDFCRLLRDQFQCHILIVEYPGYGICKGPPSEDGMARNAFAAMNFILYSLKWSMDSVIIMGRSIGSAPSLKLCEFFKVAGLILIAPFANLRDVVFDLLGPLGFVVPKDYFQNDECMKKVRSPCLIVHGRRDMLISTKHSEILYDICKSRKLLVLPREMDHNTHLLQHVGYFVLPVLQFFNLPEFSFKDLFVPKWSFVQLPKLSTVTDVVLPLSTRSLLDNPKLATTIEIPAKDNTTQIAQKNNTRESAPVPEYNASFGFSTPEPELLLPNVQEEPIPIINVESGCFTSCIDSRQVGLPSIAPWGALSGCPPCVEEPGDFNMSEKDFKVLRKLSANMCEEQHRRNRNARIKIKVNGLIQSSPFHSTPPETPRERPTTERYWGSPNPSQPRKLGFFTERDNEVARNHCSHVTSTTESRSGYHCRPTVFTLDLSNNEKSTSSSSTTATPQDYEHRSVENKSSPSFGCIMKTLPTSPRQMELIMGAKYNFTEQENDNYYFTRQFSGNRIQPIDRKISPRQMSQSCPPAAENLIRVRKGQLRIQPFFQQQDGIKDFAKELKIRMTEPKRELRKNFADQFKKNDYKKPLHQSKGIIHL